MWALRNKTQTWNNSAGLQNRYRNARVTVIVATAGYFSSVSSFFTFFSCKFIIRVTSERQGLLYTRSQTNFLVGPQEPLLATQETETCTAQAYTRHDSLPETILRGTLEGGRRRGRQRKCWTDNVNEWTSLPTPELLTRASCGKDWTRISAESSPPPPPSTQSVKRLK